VTGRKLYDRYVDSVAREGTVYDSARVEGSYYTVSSALRERGNGRDGWLPVAWPFLKDSQKRVWSDLAKGLAPQRRRA
jgi:hypothetical protein